MAERLPKTDHGFKKRGFYTPIREWFFTQRQRQRIAEYFSPAEIRRSGIFNAATVNKLYEQLVSMPAPRDMDSYYRCMKLEWVLLTVLSVQMLQRLFIDKQSPCFERSTETGPAYALAGIG